MTGVRIAFLLCLLQVPAAAGDVFEDYLQTEASPADGFDFPVGNADGKGAYTDKNGNSHQGWYVALGFGKKFSLGIHPGEDWNGKGGKNTDAGQPVHAVASGKVIYADMTGKLWGRVVMIQHVYYENHEKKRLRSLYAHLGEVRVEKGDDVERRQVIGTIGRDPEKLYHAHLHLELRLNEDIPAIYWPSAVDKSLAWIKKNYAHPSRFIRSHRKLFVPQKEDTLVLIDQDSYEMRLYKDGELEAEYKVGFGQGKGRKRRRGDLKTPKGMYFVIDKKKGEFGGDYGAFYGGHWIKFNYPNPYDAAFGRQRKIISRATASRIARKWSRRRPTNEGTRLGGGIGFHGWIDEWDDKGPRHLSWGCVVLHNRDIGAFYAAVSAGTMVVIF